MKVAEGMSDVVLTVGPGHTLRAAARAMSERRVGAAVVMDPDAHGPGLITERDILVAVARGRDPDQALVADHLTKDVISASPEWPLERAAEVMVRHGFRHLVVVRSQELVGVLSMRDIVRCWTAEGATSDVPAGASA